MIKIKKWKIEIKATYFVKSSLKISALKLRILFKQSACFFMNSKSYFSASKIGVKQKKPPIFRLMVFLIKV